jgi:hypothetical protein
MQKVSKQEPALEEERTCEIVSGLVRLKRVLGMRAFYILENPEQSFNVERGVCTTILDEGN